MTNRRSCWPSAARSGTRAWSSTRPTRARVCFIAARATTERAREPRKRGALDCLQKPLELPQLRQVIDRALAISRLMQVPAVVADAAVADDRIDAIVGSCPEMREVYK